MMPSAGPDAVIISCASPHARLMKGPRWPALATVTAPDSGSIRTQTAVTNRSGSLPATIASFSSESTARGSSPRARCCRSSQRKRDTGTAALGPLPQTSATSTET